MSTLPDPKHTSDEKPPNWPSSWGVSTPEGGNLNQDNCPSGHGSVHVDAPGGGYTLSVGGFDNDGFPRVSRWYDDD